jgi:hypothetical protein
MINLNEQVMNGLMKMMDNLAKSLTENVQMNLDSIFVTLSRVNVFVGNMFGMVRYEINADIVMQQNCIKMQRKKDLQ